jgi:hypothetical protein
VAVSFQQLALSHRFRHPLDNRIVGALRRTVRQFESLPRAVAASAAGTRDEIINAKRRGDD